MSSRPRNALRRRALAPLSLLGVLLFLGSTSALASSKGTSPSPAAPPVWSQFQGGASHEGAATSAALPPYRIAWTFQEPGSDQGLSAPVIEGDSAYAVGLHGVYGVSLSTGTQTWSVQRAGGPLASPAIGLDQRGGAVIVFIEGTGASTSVVGASIADQKRLWTAKLNTDSTGGVTIGGGTVYVGDNGGNVYAIDLSKGTILWQKSLGAGVVEAPPAVSDGKLYSVVRNRTTGTATIVALDASTGARAWTYAPRTGGPAGFSAISVGGGSVFAATLDRTNAGHVLALDAGTGALRWSSLLRFSASLLSSPAYADGNVVVADFFGGVYEVDASTGKILWDFQLNPVGPQASRPGVPEVRRGAPVVAGGSVVIGLDDGRLAAIDRANGHLAGTIGTGEGSLKSLAVGPGVIVAAKGGKQGGLVGFVHDPSRKPTDVISPTHLQLATALQTVAAGLIAVFASVFLVFKILGGLLGRVGLSYEEEPELVDPDADGGASDG